MVQKSQATKRREQKAPTRTRRGAVAIIIRENKGEVLIIRLLRKQGVSEGRDLHAKVDMRIIASYLTLKIGFSLLRGIRTPNKFINKDKFYTYHNEAEHITFEC